MSDLVVIENVNSLQVFVANGLDPIIEKIEQQVKGEDFDISTEAGRKRIASLAYKVAQSKTALDAMGKKLTEDWKARSKAVDAERARAWDKLEALQKQIRKPLTDWEEAEAMRIGKHKSDIAELVEAGRHTTENWITLPLDAMRDRLSQVRADGEKDWQEFSSRGRQAVESATAAIVAAISKRQAYDNEQAELARLRQEEADRKQREHEEGIAAEAAAKARADAEATAEGERQAIVREKEEAETRAAKAEADRIASEEKAKADAAAAEAQAKKDAELAVQRERQRAEAEKHAEAEATAKREADKKHRAKLNNEILNVLKPLIGEELGKAVIEQIAKGSVPHVKITY